MYDENRNEIPLPEGWMAREWEWATGHKTMCFDRVNDDALVARVLNGVAPDGSPLPDKWQSVLVKEATWSVHHSDLLATMREVDTYLDAPDEPNEALYDRKVDYEFRCGSYNGAAVKVGVSPDHYWKAVRVILDLQEVLHKKIPFEFAVMSEPEVVIQGGSRVRGILAVEMVIMPVKLSQAEALRVLREVGFWNGFESTLG